MRFGSIRTFLKFIVLLEGMGYKALSPLYDIEEELKALPYYISNYHCTFMTMRNAIQVSLYKDKALIWYIILEKTPWKMDEEKEI